jgi:hypothetical protein
MKKLRSDFMKKMASRKSAGKGGFSQPGFFVRGR